MLATNNPSKTENSFTRKLKENRQTFRNQKISQQNQRALKLVVQQNVEELIAEAEAEALSNVGELKLMHEPGSESLVPVNGIHS